MAESKQQKVDPARTARVRQEPTNPDPLTVALAAVLAPIVRKAVADAFEEYAAGEPLRPELLTQDQICQLIQVSRATLHRLRSEGLPTLWIGDSPRFRLVDVMAWVELQSAARDAPGSRKA